MWAEAFMKTPAASPSPAMVNSSKTRTATTSNTTARFTAEERNKQAAARDEMTKAQLQYGKLVQKLIGPNRVKDKDESKKVSDQLTKLRERLAELTKQAGK
jgi:hypothetical protein